MSTIDRPLSGDVLVFDLAEERERANDPAILARSGRSARTLVKTDRMRVMLVVLAADGELSEHHADGRITVQPVEGTILFTVQGHTHELGPGSVIALGPGVRHAVSSRDGATFLVTISPDR